MRKGRGGIIASDGGSGGRSEEARKGVEGMKGMDVDAKLDEEVVEDSSCSEQRRYGGD